MHNWKKYSTLFSLYIAQSVPMSFFSTVIPVIMRQENYSLESIGLIQLVKLPWIFKFLWAPFIDNYTVNRKQIRNWIVVSELFYAVVIFGIAFLNLQTDFKLIIGLVIFALIASATQDIATDIFAIKILKKGERSFGNSVQSAGSFAGSLIGTGVLLVAYYYFGWQNLLMLLALCVVFAVIPIIIYKPEISEKVRSRINFGSIFSFFKEKGNGRHALLLVFYYSGLIGILAMLKPYLVDLGYNVKEIGFMSGILGTATAILATVVSGFIVHRLGRKTSFFLFAIFNIFVGLYFVWLSGLVPTLTEIYAGIFLLWGAYGLSTVIIYTSSMDRVRKGREGTDFTVQIVITHLSGIIIAILSGRIGDRLGYTGLYMSEVTFGILALLIVYFNYPIFSKK